MLAASEGTFSFSIAICNSPSLRDYLISKLKEETPSIAVVEINKEVTDILDFAGSNVTETNNTGIFITGIEKLLPSDPKDFKVLRVLNATRESWRPRFSCPVVFWLAEYAATLLSIHARDLWSWVSHRFEFISEQATASAGMMDSFSSDILSAGSLNVDEKRFRIAELEQRIADAGDPPKEQLAEHVLIWLNELAYIFNSLGDLTKSEESIRKSLEIEEKLGLLEGMAGDYGNLGLIYRMRGDLDKAEQMHRKALEIKERLGLQEGMAIDYGNLGLIYQTRGELDKADQMHRKSLEIEEKLGRIEGMASDYGNLGMVYQTRGDLDKAEQMHRKSLEIEEKLGRIEGMASDYGNLGLIYRMRGELDKAEQMHRKSLEIDEKLGLLEGMANQYGNLGVIYEERGDLKKAKEYWEKAVELYKKIGMPQMVKKVEEWIEGMMNDK